MATATNTRKAARASATATRGRAPTLTRRWRKLKCATARPWTRSGSGKSQRHRAKPGRGHFRKQRKAARRWNAQRRAIFRIPGKGSRMASTSHMRVWGSRPRHSSSSRIRGGQAIAKVQPLMKKNNISSSRPLSRSKKILAVTSMAMQSTSWATGTTLRCAHKMPTVTS